MARLVLASRGIPGLAAILGARLRHAVLIPDAAAPLDEPGIPAEVEHELREAGLEVTRVGLAASTAQQVHAAVVGADAIAVSGGNPFHLLIAARRAGFGAAAHAALQAGAVYIGYSAGAMVAAPTLEPLSMTSPFTAPPGLDLTGLGLVDALILPHDDHPDGTSGTSPLRRRSADRSGS